MDDITHRSQFRIGDLLVIPARLVVVRDGQEIKFEKRWMQVLAMLAEHVGETLSTERLLIGVWGSDIYGDNPVAKQHPVFAKASATTAENRVISRR